MSLTAERLAVASDERAQPPAVGADAKRTATERWFADVPVPPVDLRALVPPPDPWLRRLRVASACVLLTMGAGFTAGPDSWRANPSFAVVRELPGGLRAWGAVFVVLGVCLLVALLRHVYQAIRLCFILSAGVTGAWAVSFVAAALVGRAAAPSGPAMWGFFALAQIVQAGRVQRTR